LSFILISWLVEEFSKTICHVIFQITLIITAVWFYVSSMTLTTTIYELSLKIIAVIKLKRSISRWLVVYYFSAVICLKWVDINFLLIFLISSFEPRNIGQLR
jgi:hypothetical protein